jgi:hypothetical protein
MCLGLAEGGLGIGIHPMTPYAAYAASFYSAYPFIYANTPSAADDIAQAAAMPLHPAPYPVSDFVKAVTVLGHKDFNCVQFLGMEPSTNGSVSVSNRRRGLG